MEPLWDADGDDPGRCTGRSRPEPWTCLDCPAVGAGYVTHGDHWRATKHRIVWGTDPRARATTEHE